MAETDEKRLLWQCRRGMLELDYLLKDFLTRDYLQLSPAEQKTFSEILTCSDPQLQAWLVLNEKSPDKFHKIIKMIIGKRDNTVNYPR